MDWLEATTAPDLWTANRYLSGTPSDGGLSRIPSLRQTNSTNQETIAATNEQKSKILAESFFPPKPPPPPPDPTPPGYPDEIAPLPRITREQIRRHALALSPYKAPGPDGIPNIVLTKTIDIILEHLYYIYSSTMNLHTYYGPWKHWTTIVLRKPRKPHYDVAKAYRPIALYNTLSKLLTSTITEQMSYLTERHNLLPPTHFGGRPGHSTTDAMHLITQTVRHAWRNKRVVSALFLDIEGAFPMLTLTS